MVLTGHELTAASSAVAVLAILGGYLGVRSANRNALRIAREERSSRRKDEFDYLKRSTYARFLEALATLAMASLEQEEVTADPHIRGETRILAFKRRANALTAARNIAAELDLLTPDLLRGLVNESIKSGSACTRKNEQTFERVVARLRVAMRYDLQGSGIPNLTELERLTHTAIAAQSSSTESEHPVATPSITSGTEIPDSSSSPI
jgi:hypothetical protein